jgi:Mg2+-importing ATPase
LSLAKLFLDQAIPSAGVGGTAAVAEHLERMGMSLPVVMATAVLNISSYFLSHVVLLIPAMLIFP